MLVLGDSVAYKVSKCQGGKQKATALQTAPDARKPSPSRAERRRLPACRPAQACHRGSAHPTACSSGLACDKCPALPSVPGSRRRKAGGAAWGGWTAAGRLFRVRFVCIISQQIPSPLGWPPRSPTSRQPGERRRRRGEAGAGRGALWQLPGSFRASGRWLQARPRGRSGLRQAPASPWSPSHRPRAPRSERACRRRGGPRSARGPAEHAARWPGWGGHRTAPCSGVVARDPLGVTWRASGEGRGGSPGPSSWEGGWWGWKWMEAVGDPTACLGDRWGLATWGSAGPSVGCPAGPCAVVTQDSPVTSQGLSFLTVKKGKGGSPATGHEAQAQCPTNPRGCQGWGGRGGEGPPPPDSSLASPQWGAGSAGD